LAWQSGSLLLLQRFLTPLNNHATATDLYFAIDTPGNVVARGDDVLFQARPMWRSGANREPPLEAAVLLKSVSGHSDSLQMGFDQNEGCYTATLRNVSSSMNWRITAGRASTESRTLRVVDRPQLADAVLTAIPPDYTGLPARDWPGITGSIDVLAGSQIKLTLTANAPIVSAELIWLDDSVESINGEADENDKTPAASDLVVPFAMHADATSASVSSPAERGGTFQLRLTDQYNITNRDEQHRQLRLLTDQPPTLNVRGIRSQETMRSDAIVPLNVVAHDDIGLTSLELHIQQGDEDSQIIPANDFTVGDRDTEHDFRTDLAELNLKQGDDVQLRVRATDGCLPEPHEVWSDVIQIQIDSNADAVGADAMNEATKHLVEQLESVRRQLRKDTQAVNELSRQSRESWTQSSQANTVRLAEQQQQHGRQLEDLAQQASRHPLMASPASDLGELAKTLRHDVSEQLNTANTSDSAAAIPALEQSKESIMTARAELDRIIDQVQQAGKLEQDLAELNRLALEAEKLAKDAVNQQQSDPADETSSAESERIESERRNLTDDLTKLLAEQARLRDAAQQAVRDRLNKAAEQAAELATRQEQVSDGVAQQADERGDSVAPAPNEPHAGAENLLNRIEELSQAAERMSQAVASQASSDAAKQLRTAASQAADMSRAGQFDKSANMLREAAGAAKQHQEQSGAELSKDQASQSARLQNQLKQAANLIADLEQNDLAQLAVQQAAQSDIATDTKELADKLSQIRNQSQMPALELVQEQSAVEAAEQSSSKARNDSGEAADKLPTGQLRDAAEQGAKAAAALRRVAEVAQQPSPSEPEDGMAVPTEVGQSVTDALQNLSDAAQPAPKSSDGNSAPNSDGESASGSSESQDPDGASGDPNPAKDSAGNQSMNATDGDPSDGSETGEQPGDGSQSANAEDQRARQLANAAAALSSAARQSLPGLNDNDTATDSDGQQAGTGTSLDDVPNFAAELATPSQPAVQQRKWGQLHDELSSDILSGDQESGDHRYAPLIRAYFRELARQSATTSPTTTP